MADAPSYLAVDLGASSGRAVIGTLDHGVMRMREVHRFRTPLIEEGGHLFWDIDALWNDVRGGLARTLDSAPTLRSVAIDSWAVDYVPLDANGTALRRPYAYRDARTRDPRTERAFAEALARIGGRDALYARTGTQFLDFNTLRQVVADVALEPALVERVASRLLIAEYLTYRLCGVGVAERTMASTTQAMDATSGEWDHDVIHSAGDDPSRWPKIVPPGTTLGTVRADALPVGASAPLVLTTCAHDTAAAVAAVPADAATSWAYVSSGTWSLVGAGLDAPILTPQARAAGFTNEAGLDDTIRFLKNRTGMWVLEECVRAWSEAGERPTWDTLFGAAAAAPSSDALLDLDAPSFAERGDMPAKLDAACRSAGIALPEDRGALVRLVLDSLATGYARTLDELESLTGKRVDVVHVVGGGARNDLLNQLTADACARRVIAGPDEATVLGNLLVQARALGDLPPGESVRDVARRSATLKTFEPVSPATLR